MWTNRVLRRIRCTVFELNGKISRLSFKAVPKEAEQQYSKQHYQEWREGLLDLTSYTTLIL